MNELFRESSVNEGHTKQQVVINESFKPSVEPFKLPTSPGKETQTDSENSYMPIVDLSTLFFGDHPYPIEDNPNKRNKRRKRKRRYGRQN